MGNPFFRNRPRNQNPPPALTERGSMVRVCMQRGDYDSAVKTLAEDTTGRTRQQVADLYGVNVKTLDSWCNKAYAAAPLPSVPLPRVPDPPAAYTEKVQNDPPVLKQVWQVNREKLIEDLGVGRCVQFLDYSAEEYLNSQITMEPLSLDTDYDQLYIEMDAMYGVGTGKGTSKNLFQVYCDIRAKAVPKINLEQYGHMTTLQSTLDWWESKHPNQPSAEVVDWWNRVKVPWIEATKKWRETQR